jgi:hypothetical protein
MPYNLPTLAIPRPSKIYPYWDFWHVHLPAGNPETELVYLLSTKAT